MTSSLLITNGRLLDPEGELHDPPVADILIRNGAIAAIGPAASAAGAERVLDASGHLITPGFVNAHSHSHDTLLRGAFEALPLEVWGLLAFPSGWPRRPDAEIHLRGLLHGAECLRNGITTVQDMVTLVGPDAAHLEQTLSAYSTIGIRTVLALQLADRATAATLPFSAAFAHLLPQTDFDTTAVRAFIEAALDWPVSPRISWGLGPSAPQRCSDQLLSWAAELSAERGLQVFTHLYETRSQAVLAAQGYEADGHSMVSQLARLGLLDERLVVAHGVWTAPDEILRLGEAGAHLATNPGANFKLLNGVAPLRDYAAAGVNIALGCDNSSAGDAQNILVAMRQFATAWSLQGEAGDTGGAAAAFRAATLGGAAALGMSGRIGCLRPGARADLVLFDLAEPPFWPLASAVNQLVYAEAGGAIRHVLVDGELVVRDRRLVALSEAELARRANTARAEMAADMAALADRSAPLRDGLLAMHARVLEADLPFDRLGFRGAHIG